MEKLKVGQIIYSKPAGHRLRKGREGLEEFVVAKVGRKYFYACPIGCEERIGSHYKYRIDNWAQVTDYTKTSVLYRDRQAWLDEKEIGKAEHMLCQRFRSYGSTGLSLDQLRRIVAIIEEGED